MQDKRKISEQQSPADIAREAFRRLALRRIAPTPDAYRQIYDEVAGIGPQASPEKMLAELARSLAGQGGEPGGEPAKFARAVEERDWAGCAVFLKQLLETRRKETFASNLVAVANEKAHAGAQRTASAATRGEVPDASATPLLERQNARILREMLNRALTFALASFLQNTPDLAQETQALAQAIREAATEQALNEAAIRLKQLCFSIELRCGDMAEEHELLLRLFKLLLDNIKDLLENESWLSGQIAAVQNLLAGPITYSALLDATRNLKQVIYQQGILKQSMETAKESSRKMLGTFIDKLDAVAASTGAYHEKIDRYAGLISRAGDATQIGRILEDIKRDTRDAQVHALQAREDMVAARQEVIESQARIRELESKLAEMSDKAREDQLTGSLNRHGLDDMLEREMARSRRRNSPLCVGLLDLDDFKRINDTYGHSTGDQALIHLVRVIKDTLRAMDVIGRFGGEEFLILLPDTPLDDAKLTVQRVQRELTKRIFMHNHERLLMTFSAGVALRGPDEDRDSLIRRADEALYEAKRAGKNRVVAAP